MNRCTRAQRWRRMHWHFCLCRRPKPTDELEHNQPHERRKPHSAPSCCQPARSPRSSLRCVRTGCAPCSPHTACARRSRNHSRNTSTYRYTHRPHTWHSHRAHGAHGHGESSVKVGSPTPSLLEYTHIYGMPLQSQGIAARLGRPRSNRQRKRRGIRSAALLAPDALRRPLRVFRRVGSHPKRLPQGRVLDVALPKLFA